MLRPSAVLRVLLPASVLAFGLAPTAEAGPRDTEHTTPTNSKRGAGAKKARRSRKAPRLHPRVRNDRQPRARPVPERQAPGPSAPSLFGDFGSKIAGKHVELSANQLGDQNVGMIVLDGRVSPVPMHGQPHGVAAKSVLILYPMSTLSGTDLRLKCTGLFLVDLNVAVGPIDAADGEFTAFDDMVFKKKGGDSDRESFQLIVETGELATNAVLAVAIEIPMYNAFQFGGAFNKCTIDQME